MNTTDFQKMNDGATERRIREYQLQLADQVEAGELTEVEANQWASDFQDRMARDGAWS